MIRRAALAVLLASTSALVGCPGSGRPPRAQPAPRPPQRAAPALPHAWPPAKGQPFPALELLDIHGASVQLSSLAGKVLIVEPVGLSCPGCQAYSGGAHAGGFRGVEPQPGLLSIDDLLASRGIDPAHPDLVLVQLIFYDMSAAAAPTVADARAWAEHFGLDRRPNTVVLVGDERYVSPETYSIIPGYYVVDRELQVVGDLTSATPPDDHDAVLGALAALLGPLEEGPDFVPPGDLSAAYPELGELAERERCLTALAAGDFEDLEARVAALRAAGRRPGDFALLLDLAVDELSAGDSDQVGPRLEAWCEARPASAVAHLVRGDFMISWAWEARGSGYANTVTEEGWRLFRARLGQARRDLERAVTLDPKLATAHARLITVGMGQQLEPAEEKAFFDAAVAADPTYVDAYVRRLTAIMPKWGGTRAGMWQFVQDAGESAPDEPAMGLLAIEAFMEEARRSPRHLEDAQVRRSMLEAAAAMTAAYPRAQTAWFTQREVAQAFGDEALARRALLGAADAGSGWLQAQLASVLFQGASGFRRDRPRAAELALRAALQGRPEGMLLFGYLLESGTGIAADAAAAVDWYERAAEAGLEPAMLALADALLAGRRGAPDPEGAVAWLQRAATSDDPDVAGAAQQRLAALEADRGAGDEADGRAGAEQDAPPGAEGGSRR